MHSTESEGLSRTLVKNHKRNSFLVSAEKSVERVPKVISEGDYLVQLNDYKVSKDNMERKTSEQDIILKATTLWLMPPEMKLRSVEIVKGLLGKTDKNLLIMYGARSTMVEKM